MSDREGVSVSIKGNGGKDDTWEVFHGTPENVKNLMADYYGLEVSADMTAMEVRLMAEAAARGTGALSRGLGARVATTAPQPASEAPGAPAAAAAAEDFTWLLEAIDASATEDALHQLWAENRKLFDANPSLLDAWKARGRALVA